MFTVLYAAQSRFFCVSWITYHIITGLITRSMAIKCGLNKIGVSIFHQVFHVSREELIYIDQHDLARGNYYRLGKSKFGVCLGSC